MYLDNAATTKPLDELEQLYREYSSSLWENPSSLYGPSVLVRRAIEEARTALEQSFGSGTSRCLFTAGGTEGANMAITCGFRKRKGGNFVCGGFEHPCVEQSFMALREQGHDVRFARVRPDGSTSMSDILSVVDQNTVLVSVMHVNNETGAVNEIEALARAVKQKAPRAVFHADGVQGWMHVPLRDAACIDYYTVSAHKIHGPRGAGALFYLPRSPLKELLHGGGQEKGLRSGTENTFGILGMQRAAQWNEQHRSRTESSMDAARKALLSALAGVGGIQEVCPPERSAPHILSLFVDGVRGETLQHALEEDTVYIGTGSACSSKKGKSRVSKALGIPEEQAGGMVRISFSAFTREDDAERAGAAMRARIVRLRR